MYVGREITVYYDPNKPRHVKTMGFVFDDLFLVGIGLVFFIIGISFTASQLRNSDFANGCWKPAGQYTQTLVKSL